VTALPRLLLLTDRAQAVRPLPDVVAAAVDAGARAVVLRERDLPAPERDALADVLRRLLDAVDGTLVLAGGAVPAAAVHLTADEPLPEPRPELVGRSCHGPDEVRAAAAEGCDWVTVSPVRLTASKPGYGPALGTSGLAECCGLGAPVYALGGLDAEDADTCRSAGAHGLAVMGAVMRDPDPGRVVAGLLRALDAA
jgi:thiamine-phosphate pyrophosphorylase